MSDTHESPSLKVILHNQRCPETDIPLFWSNQDGWVDLASATVFDIDADLDLPLEAWGTVELPAVCRPCRNADCT